MKHKFGEHPASNSEYDKYIALKGAWEARAVAMTTLCRMFRLVSMKQHMDTPNSMVWKRMEKVTSLKYGNFAQFQGSDTI